MTAPADPRLLNLSYSSLKELHTCPRKFQLKKLNATVEEEESYEAGITFAFGHCVGYGIALSFCGATEDEIVWELFNHWKPDLFAVNEKQKKSFWLAVAAVQQFISLRANGFLQDWEVVDYKGNFATELSFCVSLPNGYKYRGFVDVVLQNIVTQEVMVLECKTNSATNLNPSDFKNSAQAIGYSIVLDHIFPDISSYQVLYLVYLSKQMKFEQLPFTKSYLQRALWIQELLLDCEVISLYDTIGVYPMRGENCVQYYRDCEYLNTCTLSTKYLTKPLSKEEAEKLAKKEAQYQINVTLEQLIEAQLKKV